MNEDAIPVRCDVCMETHYLSPREEAALPPGPFVCSDQCDDRARATPRALARRLLEGLA